MEIYMSLNDVAKGMDLQQMLFSKSISWCREEGNYQKHVIKFREEQSMYLKIRCFFSLHWLFHPPELQKFSFEM